MLKRLQDEWLQARNLLGFSTLQIIGQAAVMAVPLVVAALFSPDMWGRYSLCEPVIFFFSALLILSAKTPIIVFANQERTADGAIRKTFTVQCIFLLASILLFVLITVPFARPIARFADIKPTNLFYIGLAFLAIIFKDFAGNLFMALNRRINNAAIELAFGILTLAFIFLFYFLKWIDLRSIFLSYFLASVLVLLISALMIDRKMLFPLALDRDHLRDIINFTLWAMAGTVSVYLINWAGLFILRRYNPVEVIGTYNLAYKFFKGFIVLMCIVPTYFLPHVSENITNAAKLKAYLFSKRPRIVLLGIVLFAFAWMIMPWVFELPFYADKSAGASDVVRILIIGAVLFLYTSMYGPILAAMKLYKFQQILTVSQVAVNVALNLLLIPRWGLTGAALATVLSYLYLTIGFEFYYWLKLRKLLDAQ